MDSFCGDVLWDNSITWDTERPDFTLCFQNSILLWIPCVVLWLLIPLECFSLYSHRKQCIPWTILIIFKIIILISLMVLAITEIIITLNLDVANVTVYPVDYFTPSLKLLSFILVFILLVVGRKNGMQSSGVLFVFWLLLTISHIIIYRSTLLRTFDEENYQESEFSFIISVIYLSLVIGELFLCCFADIKPDYYIVEDDYKNDCPEKYASFPSKILFCWCNSMIFLGYKKSLELSDMWTLSSENRTDNMSIKFNKYWIPMLKQNFIKNVPVKKKSIEDLKEVEFSKKKINILYPILKTFSSQLIIVVILKLIGSILTFVNPLILDKLIAFVAGNEPYWRGFFFAFLMFISSMFESFFNNQYEFKIYSIAMRIRSCIISAIYRKSLTLASSAKRNFTVGEIVNLMAVDTQRIMDYVQLVNLLWSTPLQIGLALYLLWQQLGIATLGGLAIMIIFIPINSVISTKLRQLQVHLMKEKDKRINIMNEILSGIKVLKLYAWEKPFQKTVMDIRNEEIKLLEKQAYLTGFMMFFFTSAPFIVGLASFTVFVFISPENVLDANRAFVSLSLFNILRVPLAFLPMLITFTAMFIVSLRRINKFLRCSELDLTAIEHDDTEEDPIVMEDASFSWEDCNPILKDLTVNIKEGSLVAVVGQVGAGKSSFLSALLGEMNKEKGRVNVKGTFAYVPQQAWIQNATLRKNIQFIKPYRENKYNKIIEACALKADLEMLPAGDQTEIGEKGINLSGGQKQRVSLARAVYNDADIYLLDDPLSAVDSHVGKHIFEKVIGPEGMLKKKTRILATHRISVLPEVDVIMVLKDGYLSEYGTYAELLHRKGAFAQFLIQFLSDAVEVDALPIDEISIIEEIATTVGAPTELQRQLSRISGTESEVSESGEWKRKLSKQLSERQLSKSEKAEITKTIPKKTAKRSKLTDIENIEVGSVKWHVYFSYLKAIGYKGGILTLLAYLISHSFNIATSVWLSLWSNDAEDPSKLNDTKLRDLRLGVYGGLGGSEAIFVFFAAIIMNLACIRASKLLHNEMLEHILHAPMSFFDTTPMGRILNRFSKDVDTTDITIRFNIRMLLVQTFRALVAFIVICMETAFFLVVIIPLGILYYLLQKFYIPTSRQMKRLESTTRSPIYIHFSETITGTTSILAYRATEQFVRESNHRVDINHSCYFPSLAANRWLAIRLEFLGYTIVFFAALFAVITKDTLSPGTVGLSVSYALTITATLNALVKASTDVETNIVSIERILEYTQIKTEASWYIENRKPSKTWPEDGNIQFENYCTQYREGLDLVLDNINCDFKAGEKVGIVGRTGAGKSSLTLSLFRIIEATTGKIFVDGVNVSTIGLHDLRSKLTIIPQDPVLFTGTLRKNLDPFAIYSDQEIWIALEHSHLKSFVCSLEAGLQHHIVEGGENLSVGQKQLICLARALLRKTRILVLDEATAAIDMETDELIQTTIRSEFADSTVITIAHRLNTIMDYDRVMVLSKGHIIEWDSPAALLENKNSEFYSMAKDANLI